MKVEKLRINTEQVSAFHIQQMNPAQASHRQLSDTLTQPIKTRNKEAENKKEKLNRIISLIIGIHFSYHNI